jgi:hypothetical protein
MTGSEVAILVAFFDLICRTRESKYVAENNSCAGQIFDLSLKYLR